MAAAQTARTTILSTPDFKIWLINEAKKEGISLSELVKTRCKNKPNEEERALSALIKEVNRATKKAKSSLNRSLKNANKTLAEIRSTKK